MPKSVDMEKVKKDARKVIAQIAEVPEKDIKDTAKFAEDLEVDSMKALEIVAGIEKKLKVVIPENKIQSFRTPKDVYDLLGKLLKK